jgi:hypothetical protein
MSTISIHTFCLRLPRNLLQESGIRKYHWWNRVSAQFSECSLWWSMHLGSPYCWGSEDNTPKCDASTCWTEETVWVPRALGSSSMPSLYHLRYFLSPSSLIWLHKFPPREEGNCCKMSLIEGINHQRRNWNKTPHLEPRGLCMVFGPRHFPYKSFFTSLKVLLPSPLWRQYQSLNHLALLHVSHFM